MRKILPWHWRNLPLKNRTGSEIFELLFRQNLQENIKGTIATLLESPNNNKKDLNTLSRYSICAGSPRIIAGKHQLWTPKIGKILPFLRDLQTRTAKNNDSPQLPFTGGWLGWLGYDLAKEIEKIPTLKPDPLPFPVAYWYEPESFAVLDHWEQKLWLACTNPEDLDKLQSQLDCSVKSKFDPEKQEIINSKLPQISFLTSKNEYEQAVLAALKYIKTGDVFQANLSLRFQSTTQKNSWGIYKKLQNLNPSPFASYWETPWGIVISCSPERLIQLTGRIARTRPIAGTRSRGIDPETDKKLATELLGNVKERAEHIMLVDLERNDLGRVCEWGSVVVDELLTIERYSHVMHLVSNVAGTLREDCDSVDLIRALFPGGTITGCPKVRCMEIIEELEPVSRSLFYGSCGYLDQRGNLDLNILIRTLLLSYDQDDLGATFSRVWGQVGAGIVADSDPEKEWYESLHKAEAQLTALAGCTLDNSLFNR